MGTTLEQGLQNKCITVMVMVEYMLSRNETIGLETTTTLQKAVKVQRQAPLNLIATINNTNINAQIKDG